MTKKKTATKKKQAPPLKDAQVVLTRCDQGASVSSSKASTAKPTAKVDPRHVRVEAPIQRTRFQRQPEGAPLPPPTP